MDKYRPQELYFAIESSDPEQHVVFITPKDAWDDTGEPEEMTAASFEEGYFPEFLGTDTFMQSTFEPVDEDLSREELLKKMEEAGFEYSLEVQTFLSDDMEEDDDDEEEFEDEDDGFWGMMHPKSTLN